MLRSGADQRANTEGTVRRGSQDVFERQNKNEKRRKLEVSVTQRLELDGAER